MDVHLIDAVEMKSWGKDDAHERSECGKVENAFVVAAAWATEAQV
jgi:hypothetical protein